MGALVLPAMLRERWLACALVGTGLLALVVPTLAAGPLTWLPVTAVVAYASLRRAWVAAVTVAALGSFALLTLSTTRDAGGASVPLWATLLLTILWLVAATALRPGRAAGTPAGDASGSTAAGPDGTAENDARADITDTGTEDVTQTGADFRQLIEYADTMTIVVGAEGRIRYVNATGRALLGTVADALRGGDPCALAHPDDAARLRDLFERCRRKPEASLSIPRLRMRAADGDWAWLDARVSALSPQHGAELVLSGKEITDQVRAEKALHRSETRFASLFEASRDALLIARAADGTALDFNEAFTQLTGWSRDDGLGDQALDLLRLADSEDIRQVTEQLQANGQIADFETVLVTRSGRAKEISVSGRYGEIDGDLCVVTVLRDISESRRTEAALRESEEKFSLVFDRSPDAMCITRISDHVILDLNDHFVELFKIERADMVGRPMSDFSGAFTGQVLAYHEQIMGAEDSGEAVYQNLEADIDSPAGLIPTLVSTTRAEINGEPCAISLLKDMRPLKQAQARLEESEARFRGAFEDAPIGMMLVRPEDDSITQVNRILCDLLGRNEAELIGLRATQLIPEEDREEYARARDALLSGGDENPLIEARFERRDGSIVWANRHMVVQRRPDGSASRVIVQIADITEMKENRERMEKLAFYDTLTNLANRRLFNDRLEQAVRHCARSGEPAALLYLDLDNFKRVNDTLGHDAGDELLRVVAERLRACVRAEDTVARPGGDEFTILLTHVRDADAAGRVASKVLRALDAPIRLDGHEFRVTTSIGVTLAPDDGCDPKTLLRNADLAMYRAKERGRDNHQFFSEDMNTRALDRLTLENEMRVARTEQQFVLFYQPKVNLQTGEIIGMEALMRWQHPERGLLSPDDFIQVAEESGLIVPLGEWTLNQACRQVHALNGVIDAPVHVAVNISARQFADPGLTEMVEHALQSSGLDPRLLELEITETMLMLDIEEAIVTLHRLRALGVSLSIDDFGTGYSSLNYLKRLPIDHVKVDRTFVSDIPESADDMAITAAVVAMAHRLQLTVVAEGVETRAQLLFLRDHGCEYGQGYLFGPPLPFAEIRDLILTASPLAQVVDL
ncbi:MAG TPA: EAL domain-containing protein [Pseudomonadales bacterium]|nr:EAL domain-containing protein [Pseudomonadales bacterium]